MTCTCTDFPCFDHSLGILPSIEVFTWGTFSLVAREPPPELAPPPPPSSGIPDDEVRLTECVSEYTHRDVQVHMYVQGCA